MARYTVKEIYYTLQGEGAQAGRAAVFCRFTGCNLWSGHEPDRTSAVCSFCDTDFVGTDGPGGGGFAAPELLLAALTAVWTGGSGQPPPAPSILPGAHEPRPYIVFTGGEPLLQLDAELIAACHDGGFEVGVETNGTCSAPAGLDWVTVSPKAGAPFVLKAGDELKLAFPQPGLAPEKLLDLDFRCFFLQPIAGPEIAANTRAAVDYCLRHPPWRLSLQIHKLVGLP
jgi:7-carboxy-7-deazaguanine synthase (Cx14CxxC type)